MCSDWLAIYSNMSSFSCLLIGQLWRHSCLRNVPQLVLFRNGCVQTCLSGAIKVLIGQFPLT